jgi:hypothetical protein
MLHVNEDTNDDLFRKAAEDYLLKAGNPDWNTLLDKINTAPPPSTPINETVTQKKKKNPLFLFFTWPHKKERLNGTGFIFRLFRFGSWLEKSKKKINGLFDTRQCILHGCSYFVQA